MDASRVPFPTRSSGIPLAARPRSPALRSTERSLALSLAESFAVFVRALAFYPETNSRVRSSLGEVMRTATKVFESAAADDGSSDQVALVFTRGTVSVGREQEEVVAGSNLAWLAERFEVSGLAGMSLSVDTTPESLLQFAKDLLDSFRRSALDSDFDATTFRELPGLRPLERRFEGTFDGDGAREVSDAETMLQEEELRSREQRLAKRLLQNEEIQERIEELAATQPEADEENGVFTTIDLLSRIVRALPIEAVQDPESVVAHTLEVLEVVGKDWKAQEAGRDPLSHALLTASLDLFGRRSWGPDTLAENPEGERVIVAPAQRGHASDDRIDDDLDALLSEYEELPEAGASDLTMVRAENPTEQVGVYLHYLVQLEDEEKARLTHAPLARLLRVMGADTREVVRAYVEVLSPRSKVRLAERHRRRVLEFLYSSGMTRLLADFGAFSADMALQLFPEDFGVYLDSLDLQEPREHAELARVMASLGPARVAEASEKLVTETRLLEPERVRLMLSRPDPAMAPVARIVLARGDQSFKEVVVGYIRSLGPTGEETCLLQLLSDEELPRDYLADLLDPPTHPAGIRNLHERISRTLVTFVRDVADLEARRGHRLAAIRMLALFQTPEATELLNELLGGRRFLFARKESSEVRAAATSSLACHV